MEQGVRVVLVEQVVLMVEQVERVIPLLLIHLKETQLVVVLQVVKLVELVVVVVELQHQVVILVELVVQVLAE
tara:strand:+ start:176 stop:394 length:219 start_codon:yes stop_codon:yes gene_type:complete